MSDKQLSILEELASPAPPEDAAVASARRERVVGAIEDAIGREARVARRRASRFRMVTGLAIAAAIAIGLGVTWRMRAHPTPSVAHAPASVAPAPTAPIARPEVRVESALAAFRGSEEIHRGDLLHGRDVISTQAGGTAALDLPSGDRVVVEGNARVMIDFAIDGERVEVQAGAASIESAGKLRVHAGEVDVTMRDASKLTVLVRDRVSITVREGTIDVKHDGVVDVVRAPGKWPPTAPSATAIETAPPKKHDPTGTLGEQNALLQAALDARRNGD